VDHVCDFRDLQQEVGGQSQGVTRTWWTSTPQRTHGQGRDRLKPTRDCKLVQYCRESGTELSEKDVFEKAKSPDDDDIEVMMVRAMPFNLPRDESVS
jgi:hypothetical protein